MCALRQQAIFFALFLGVAWQASAQLDVSGGLAGLARTKDAVSRRASSSDPNWETGNADARPIQPGETLELADLEGPGVIKHIWITIASPEEGYARLLALRMYWDDEAAPSVEAPLGDFFGVGHGLDIPFESIPVTVSSEGRGRNCFWPMPFRKRARIAVTNEGKQPVHAFYYYIDYDKVDRLDEEIAYFHAMYRQEYHAEMGKRYLLADIVGRGHYVGTVQSVRLRLESWYGEGDDFFYLDGDLEPTLRGTGTEDYFCDGWGFRPFDTAFYGVPLFEGFQVGARSSVYRWHVADPIRFAKSLYAEIEHVGPTATETEGRIGYGERPDDFASVAYWYQVEPHKAWPPMPIGYDRFYPKELDVFAPHSELSGWYARLMAQAKLYDAGMGVEHVRLPEAAVAEMQVDLPLTNPAPVPLRVTLRVAPHERVKIETANPSVEVPANGSATIPLRIAPDPGPVELARIGTIQAELDMVFVRDGAEAIEITVPQRILLETEFPCGASAAALEVDGDVSEWGELLFDGTYPAQVTNASSSYAGPGDCAYRFDVRHDDEFLYIGVEVRDDRPVVFPDLLPWQQDGIEVRLNASPEPARSEFRGEADFGGSLLIALSPGKSAVDGGLYNQSRLPDGLRAVCKATETGHASEIAIPLAYLDALQGGPWKGFQLNVAVDDADEDTSSVSQVWWRPDWRSPLSYNGSGRFIRKD